jgi:hypothetical protein
MRTATGVVAVLVAFGVPAHGASSLPDPIAPAATGQLQCYMPDVARKTCNALGGYKAAPNGGIDNTAATLISKNPPLVMETVSPVEVKAGQVCGKIRRRDIDAAQFRSDGRPLDAKQAAALREQVQLLYKDVVDREICTAYVPQGGMFLTKVTIDGAPTPAAMEQQVLWVSPDEGYRVAP